MTARRLALPLLLTLAALLGGRPLPAADAPSIEVLSAKMKVAKDLDFDITDRVREHVRDGQLLLTTELSLLPEKPDSKYYPKPIQLTLRLRVNGAEQTHELRQRQGLHVDARPPTPGRGREFELVEARWGSGFFDPGQSIDVTEVIRPFVKEGGLSVPPDTNLVAKVSQAAIAAGKRDWDEWRGAFKSLVIRYRFEGREAVSITGTNSPVRLGAAPKEPVGPPPLPPEFAINPRPLPPLLTPAGAPVVEVLDAALEVDGATHDLTKAFQESARGGLLAFTTEAGLAPGVRVFRSNATLTLKLRLRVDGAESGHTLRQGQSLVVDARPPRRPPASGELKILSARWGHSLFGPGQALEATAVLAGLVEGGRLDVPVTEVGRRIGMRVSNAGTPTDGESGSARSLYVRYESGGRESVAIFPYGGAAVLGPASSGAAGNDLADAELHLVPPVRAASAAGLLLTSRDGRTRGGDPNLGTLQRELVRQALLLAAREELGLPTRDESLREPLDAAPEGPFVMPEIVASLGEGGRFQATLFRRTGASAATTPEPAKPAPKKPTPAKPASKPAGKPATAGETKDRPAAEVLWDQDFITPLAGSPYAHLVATCEGWSRREFPEALRKAGFAPGKLAEPDGHKLPAEIRRSLEEMDLFVQFGAVRSLHAWNRRHGGTAESYAALARAYAQLGALTRFMWSPASKAFQARGLLYAERAVNLERTADTLAARSLAWALAGIHAQGAADADAAAELRRESGAAAPDWEEDLAAFCHGDYARLTRDAGGRSDLSAWLPLEFFMGTSERLTVAEQAAAFVGRRPGCHQAIFAVWETGELGERVAAARQAVAADAAIDAGLSAVPGLPGEVRAAINARKNPKAKTDPEKVVAEWKSRERVVGALLKAGGTPEGSLDLSWACLGQLVREIGFASAEAQVRVRLSLGDRADDVLGDVAPLISQHPFADYLEAQRSDPRAALAAATRFRAERPLADVAFYGGLIEPAVVDWSKWLPRAKAHRDRTFAELAPLASGSGGGLNFPREEAAGLLRLCAPEHPVSVAAAIRHDPSYAKPRLADWEKKYGDRALVLSALADHHALLKRYPDAERCLKAAIGLQPDPNLYAALAKLYARQDKRAEETELLEAALLDTHATGFEHTMIRVRLVEIYLGQDEPDKALPHGERAAESATAEGFDAAVDCFSALGRWADAERVVRAKVNRYPHLPFDWHSWCLFHGRGDERAALAFGEAARIRYRVEPAHVAESEARRLLAGGKWPEAARLLTERFAKVPQQHSGMLAVALTADAGLPGADEIAGRIAARRGVSIGESADDPAWRAETEALAAVLTGRVDRGIPDGLYDRAARDPVMEDAGNAHYSIGVAFLKAGDRERGLRHLRLARRSGHRSLGAYAASVSLKKLGEN